NRVRRFSRFQLVETLPHQFLSFVSITGSERLTPAVLIVASIKPKDAAFFGSTIEVVNHCWPPMMRGRVLCFFISSILSRKVEGLGPVHCLRSVWARLFVR